MIMVSDKAKTTQPYICDEKDQSIHIMQLPQAWNPYAGGLLQRHGGNSGAEL